MITGETPVLIAFLAATQSYTAVNAMRHSDGEEPTHGWSLSSRLVLIT